MSPSALHLSQFDPVGIFWPQTVVKQVDETVTSSTTLQDDNEIQFSILANVPYYFEMVIVFDSAAGSAVPDFKHAFALSTGTFSRGWRAYEGLGATSATAQQTIVGDMTSAIGHASASEKMTNIVRGYFQASADATLKWQWAQNTSDSNGITVHAGTLMTLRDMTLTSRLGSQNEVTGTDGWTADPATWTYASATTFTLSGDQTVKFSKGTRIKLTQTTVKYFVVTASSFSAGTTTVTITGGSDYTFANAAVSLPYYSYATNPQGYPGYFSYTPTWTSTGTAPVLNNGTLTGRFAVVGKHVAITTILNMGSTTTFGTGAYIISLPVDVNFPFLGTTDSYDSSATSAYSGHARYNTSASVAFINTASPAAFYTNTTPVTWANGDYLSFTVSGEIT